MAIVTTGLVATAQLLTLTIAQHQLGRAITSATRLAQDKQEELLQLDFVTSPSVQISPATPDPLAANVDNYYDIPIAGLYTRRWRIDAGPTATTRLVTVRVEPATADLRQARPVQLTTLLRSW